MTTQTQYDLAPANQPEFELTVTPVSDEQRIDFWPQHFGTIPQWITLEPRILAGWSVSVRPTAAVSGRSTPSVMAARLWPLMLTMTINGICSTA